MKNIKDWDLNIHSLEIDYSGLGLVNSHLVRVALVIGKSLFRCHSFSYSFSDIGSCIRQLFKQDLISTAEIKSKIKKLLNDDVFSKISEFLSHSINADEEGMEIDLTAKLNDIEFDNVPNIHLETETEMTIKGPSDSCAEAVEYNSIHEHLSRETDFLYPIPFEAKIGYRNISLLGYSILKSGKLKLCKKEEIDIGGGAGVEVQITPYENISVSAADYEVSYNVFDYSYGGDDDSGLSETDFSMPIIGTWTSFIYPAGKSQLLIVPVHVKFKNSFGVDLGEADSTMRINFDFMSSSKNKIDVAIKQVQITDLVGSVTGVDLDLAKEKTNRRLNNRYGEIRTHTIIDRGLCIGVAGGR